MRFAVLLAAPVLMAGFAGCSAGGNQPAKLTPITQTTTTTATSTTTRTTTSTSTSPTVPGAAPGVGASAAEATRWVEAAPPVDAADFHVALRNGTSTPLDDDIAFTTPSGTSCMTDIKRIARNLACLVNLSDPPAQPADVYGVWKGGWVDFDGAGVQVGSSHGDPGRFAAGQGTPLPEDRSLAFGDFRCRTDATALVCVNYSNQSAVRFSDAGIDPYDCTRQLPPTTGIGVQYTC
jgi:hypothetical protein